MFEKADTLIPGASWRDPATDGAWSTDVPVGEQVVVYCVYVHEVGRATTLRLRSRGIAARFLRGSIDGWKAAGPAARGEGPSDELTRSRRRRQALAVAAPFAAERRRRATSPSRPSPVNARTEGSGTAVTSKGSA